jgi:hypothetical protein
LNESIELSEIASAAPNRPLQGFAKTMSSFTKEVDMFYTIAIVMLILWLLGLVTAYTMGGFIHILFVIAVVMILIRLISGRNPV